MISDGAYDGWPDLRATYDSVAHEYADAFRDELDGKPFDRTVLEHLAGQLPDGALVGDLGCGPAAQVGGYLASLGHRVVGVDLSPVACALAPLPAAAGDLVRLPLGDECLDAVVCFYALIHLPRPVLPRGLEEIRRVLRPAGRAVIAMHAGEDEATERGWFGHDVDVRATFVDRSELHGLLAAAGFDDVRVARRAPYDGEHPTTRLYATVRRPS
jgi:SAM-dependent methyltransferase